jgi:hypothetical protein
MERKNGDDELMGSISQRKERPGWIMASYTRTCEYVSEVAGEWEKRVEGSTCKQHQSLGP